MDFVVENSGIILLLSNIAVNIGLITTAVKLIRHLTRIEFKVDLMWVKFEKLFIESNLK